MINRAYPNSFCADKHNRSKRDAQQIRHLIYKVPYDYGTTFVIFLRKQI